MRKKNTRRFDPRYFMDEKMEVIEETDRRFHRLSDLSGETKLTDIEVENPEDLEAMLAQSEDGGPSDESLGDVGMYDFRGSEPERVSFTDDVEENRKRYVRRMVRDHPNIPEIAIELMSRLADPRYNPEDAEPE